MCGIAGILYADPTRQVDQAVLTAMGDSIAHRGPDAQGFWREQGIGLVHRRLSIIDLAGGDQPIGNEDGTVQVICNGEIYNFRALRESLEARGHRFRTRSDAEVLVHLYEDDGEQLVSKLRGMFAFALWDDRRKTLLLARDRLGIKPLYIYRDAEKLLFGSELKAILAYPGVPRSVDLQAMEDYLTYGMVPGPRSIFQQIEKLPPAHVLSITSGRLNEAPRRYWQLRLEPDHSLTANDWQEAVSAKLSETVQLYLTADVPVGAFLSGGLDSSAVVAHCADQSDKPLQTFSVGFEEQGFNELPHARRVAQLFGTRHREEIVTPDAVALIDELTRYYDEPFADPSAIATFLLARLARREVKTVLSGDGGDEAFGGYSRYAHDLKEAKVRRCLPTWFRRCALRPLAEVWPHADWLPRPLRAKTTLTNLSLDAGQSYANTLAVCRRPMPRRLMHEDLTAEMNGHQPERAILDGYRMAPADDALGAMIAADVHTTLPDDFLVKVDRASMAHGLEVRTPLLDHELMELVGRIPSHYKVRNGHTKWILKQACKNHLPDSIIQRRKHGFDVPVNTWLRKPLREMFEAAVLDSHAPVASFINQSLARKVFTSHLAGATRNGPALWSLLIFARWTERYRPAA